MANSQTEPPGLIYSCEKKVNGNSQYEIYNSSGQKILTSDVDWAYSNTWSWIFVVNKQTKLITVYNYYGTSLGIDSIQDTQSTYSNLNRTGIKRNDKWGFYDKQGKLKIPHVFDQISHFKEDRAVVRVGTDIFIIDTNGIRLNLKYNPADKNYSFGDEDIAIGMGADFYYKEFKKITENGKVGLLDVVNNKILIPAEYDRLVDIKDKFRLITAGKNGRYGLLSFSGQTIIPFDYESVFVLNDYF
jgi:hypothetical protein